ncbi:MAG: hypothetical protein AVDCRST_MAG20-1334, partial [uncultured Acidimicrobiales bacterium]
AGRRRAPARPASSGHRTPPQPLEPRLVRGHARPPTHRARLCRPPRDCRPPPLLLHPDRRARAHQREHRQCRRRPQLVPHRSGSRQRAHRRRWRCPPRSPWRDHPRRPAPLPHPDLPLGGTRPAGGRSHRPRSDHGGPGGDRQPWRLPPAARPPPAQCSGRPAQLPRV